MQPVKIVSWDSVGNIMWGVRRWDEWPPPAQESLLSTDPEAIAHAPSLAQLFEDYDLTLRQVSSLDELLTEIGDADVLVHHKTMIPATALSEARQLRLIAHLGTDLRGTPVAAACERGIAVSSTPLENYLVVAEHTWALILNHFKRLPELRQHMRMGGDGRPSYIFPGIQGVRFKTLGLLGLGEIGRAVARTAQSFDMPALYWDIVRSPAAEAHYGITYVERDELFRRSDVVSVHLALNEKTHNCIGAREFALMKPTALFVNTARGKLVDQAALLEAVRTRQIGALGLDVFAEEPLPLDDPLRALHDDPSYAVTLTPHIAWVDHWTHIKDSQGVWFETLRILRGEPLQYQVTTESS